MGIVRVRPLLGGYAEWKRRGFPLEETLIMPAVQTAAK
jgi:3-mercaptopyruvate sulfurtransferase SseA